jgi:hypothetical protein
MPIDNKQFNELIAEDLPEVLDCELDGRAHLGSDATVRDRILGDYSTQQVVNYPFAFDILKGRKQGNRLILTDHPDVPFRGDALLLWGISEETLIHSLRSGNTEAIVINSTAIPGMMYDCPGEVGKTLDKIRMGKFVPHFYQKVSMSTANPAIRITLEISGPVTHAVLMGKGLVK